MKLAHADLRMLFAYIAPGGWIHTRYMYEYKEHNYNKCSNLTSA